MTSLAETQMYIAKTYLLPFVAIARARGLRTLDEILPVFNEESAKVYPDRKKISRSELRLTLQCLRYYGLDPGPDDRSTAAKYRELKRKMAAKSGPTLTDRS
jgi:hypothetical protein